MPRQNFLSKASFVDASEKQTRDTILSIPAFIPAIKLIAENKSLESIKFSYEQPARPLKYHIDVSVLPLNDKYTRVSLHAAYANGQLFNGSGDIKIALHDFESAIQAALRGELAQFKPYEPPVSHSKKIFQMFMNLKSSLAVFFLKKKLS
jgi:hypothetical protein